MKESEGIESLESWVIVRESEEYADRMSVKSNSRLKRDILQRIGKNNIVVQSNMRSWSWVNIGLKLYKFISV